MTTMRDIREQGGKCEKIATDFWECVDKHGKVWWCSDGGNICSPKPTAGSSQDDTDDKCGCSGKAGGALKAIDLGVVQKTDELLRRNKGLFGFTKLKANSSSLVHSDGKLLVVNVLEGGKPKVTATFVALPKVYGTIVTATSTPTTVKPPTVKANLQWAFFPIEQKKPSQGIAFEVIIGLTDKGQQRHVQALKRIPFGVGRLSINFGIDWNIPCLSRCVSECQHGWECGPISPTWLCGLCMSKCPIECW